MAKKRKSRVHEDFDLMQKKYGLTEAEMKYVKKTYNIWSEHDTGNSVAVSIVPVKMRITREQWKKVYDKESALGLFHSVAWSQDGSTLEVMIPSKNDEKFKNTLLYLMRRFKRLVDDGEIAVVTKDNKPTIEIVAVSSVDLFESVALFRKKGYARHGSLFLLKEAEAKMEYQDRVNEQDELKAKLSRFGNVKKELAVDLLYITDIMDNMLEEFNTVENEEENTWG